MKNREYSEALGLIKRTCELYIKSSSHLIGIDFVATQINEALIIIQNRLEQIENANPSEAMECLEVINNYGCGINDNMKFSEVFEKEYNTIKQALLTTQEQENKIYLKWEDLEFEENKLKRIKVKMGNHIYTLEYQSYKNKKNNIIEIADLWIDQRCISRNLGKYLFDDLRLERIE